MQKSDDKNAFTRLGLGGVDPAIVSQIVLRSASEGTAIVAGETREIQPTFESEREFLRCVAELAAAQTL